ncbi:hypothetical protein N7445_011203 [Penicillium cf. griseofulvum]|nr:hypothetical protein N7445_011203 [Penicillium cf. griseofulvum]
MSTTQSIFNGSPLNQGIDHLHVSSNDCRDERIRLPATTAIYVCALVEENLECLKVHLLSGGGKRNTVPLAGNIQVCPIGKKK